MADILGQFACSLTFARVRRCLWLVWGWPRRASQVLVPGKAQQVVEAFLEDLYISKQFQAWGNKVRGDVE
eukprot:11077479-Alexandrium_andersonii.AAC.1